MGGKVTALPYEAKREQEEKRALAFDRKIQREIDLESRACAVARDAAMTALDSGDVRADELARRADRLDDRLAMLQAALSEHGNAVARRKAEMYLREKKEFLAEKKKIQGQITGLPITARYFDDLAARSIGVDETLRFKADRLAKMKRIKPCIFEMRLVRLKAHFDVAWGLP